MSRLSKPESFDCSRIARILGSLTVLCSVPNTICILLIAPKLLGVSDSSQIHIGFLALGGIAAFFIASLWLAARLRKTGRQHPTEVPPVGPYAGASSLFLTGIGLYSMGLFDILYSTTVLARVSLTQAPSDFAVLFLAMMLLTNLVGLALAILAIADVLRHRGRIRNQVEPL